MTKLSKPTLMLLPVACFFIMLLDGHISNVMLTIFSVPMNFTSNLLLLVMLFISFRTSKNYLVVVAGCIGLLYDSYYYNLFGINVLLFPLIVLIIYTIFEFIEPSIFSLILTFVLSVTLLSVGRVFMLSVFGLTDTTILDFLARSLAPTLVIGLVAVLVFILPLMKWLEIKNNSYLK